MTRYEVGFMNKCAEYGLSKAAAGSLLGRVSGRTAQGMEGVLLSLSKRLKANRLKSGVENVARRVGKFGYEHDPVHAFNMSAKRKGKPLPFPHNTLLRPYPLYLEPNGTKVWDKSGPMGTRLGDSVESVFRKIGIM